MYKGARLSSSKPAEGNYLFVSAEDVAGGGGRASPKDEGGGGGAEDYPSYFFFFFLRSGEGGAFCRAEFSLDSLLLLHLQCTDGGALLHFYTRGISCAEKYYYSLQFE